MSEKNNRIRYTWSSSGARRSAERAINNIASNKIPVNQNIDKDEEIFKISANKEEKKPWSKLTKGIRIKKMREFFQSNPILPNIPQNR